MVASIFYIPAKAKALPREGGIGFFKGTPGLLMSLRATDEASMATVKACFCTMVVLHLACVIQQTHHSM